MDMGLEDMLTRVDELSGMLDMLCSDFSHNLSEVVPGIYKKATHVSGPQLGQQTQAHHPYDLRQRGLNGRSSLQGQGKLGDFPQHMQETPAHSAHNLHCQQGSLHQAKQIGYESPGCFQLRTTLL